MNFLRFPPALLLATLLFTACSTTPTPPAALSQEAPAPAMPRPTVLLISLDGVRPEFLGHGDTPHLDRLAREGVKAQWMNPSYPSLTFPNHYTLVTGLRPDHHGIIHNTMQDEALGRFLLSNRDAVGDSRWWAGEPIWVGAEKAGLATATLAWPGSEAEIQGIRPTRWSHFDAERLIETRVDMVAGWLAEPASTRPKLATLYFEHPDAAAHAHGPGSDELRDALRKADAGIGELLTRLEQTGALADTNIVVVSDHGMAEVPEGQVVATQDMVNPDIADVVMSGQVIGFAPRAGHGQQAEAALLGRHAQYECWRKGELPQRWHYGTHPRIPAIICQMDKGWDALPQEYIARRPAGTRGSHGYDPAHEEMRAIFIARGPSFHQGMTIPGFDNVDVYSLLAHLLGIPAAPNDGNPDTLKPILRKASTAPHH